MFEWWRMEGSCVKVLSESIGLPPIPICHLNASQSLCEINLGLVSIRTSM